MIQKTIKSDLKDAMRARNEVQLAVLRSLITGFTNELVSSGGKPSDDVSDDIALAIIKRGVKQRKDAIEQFTKGGRPELAENEEKELLFLQKYLPQQASKEEIKKIAIAKKEELGVSDKAKSGQLVGAVMKEFAGNVDGNDVKEVIDSLF